jgi:hypothetical protein
LHIPIVGDGEFREAGDFCYLARLHEWMGEDGEAAAVLARAEELYAKYWEIPFQRASFRVRAGEYDHVADSAEPFGNLLYLANDAGSAWIMPGLTPGVAGTVSNSQCTLNAGSSSVSTPGVTGGPIYYNELGLNVALTFNSTFTGLKNVYFYAAGYSGLNSGWVNDGTWTP